MRGLIDDNFVFDSVQSTLKLQDAGIGLCKFTFTVISFLPCLHTFWHAIPTSFYIFNVFKSCFCTFLC